MTLVWFVLASTLLDSWVGFLISVVLMLVGLNMFADEAFKGGAVCIALAVMIGLWSLA